MTFANVPQFIAYVTNPSWLNNYFNYICSLFPLNFQASPNYSPQNGDPFGLEHSIEPKRDTPQELLSVQAELTRYEPLFHRLKHGLTSAELEAMTAEEFWETGASGHRYSRDFVIDTVLERYASPLEDDPWQATDFHCQGLAPELYLLTYTLSQGSRVTRRTTLWRRIGGHWIAVFHQGTLVIGDSTH